jgi:serine phosphatase RsbU (regulator of sigma subunit)
MPMGVVPDLRPCTVEVGFPEGAVLVAYTDGLIERRGESLDVGFERLVRAIEAKHPEILCRELMDALVGSSIPQDDTAVVAMRRAVQSSNAVR